MGLMSCFELLYIVGWAEVGWLVKALEALKLLTVLPQQTLELFDLRLSWAGGKSF